MDLRSLRIFVEVVRRGGFSAAARTVFATQPTVSKSVQQLEDELGVRLIDRSGRHSAPSEAGRIVYRRAQAILAERDNLLKELSDLRGLRRGELRLGLSPIGGSSLFAPLFAEFRTRHPGIDIHLEEQGSRRLEELLLAGEVELAASLLPVAEEFAFQPVASEPLTVLLPARHPAAARPSLDLGMLADTPVILFDEGFAVNRLIVDAYRRRGLSPRVAARSGQVPFMVELVAAGLGTAFLPRMMAEENRHPQVARVPLDEPGTRWRLALVWRRAAYLSAAARAWLDLCSRVYPDPEAPAPR